jgi:hypothetical protein
VSLVELAMKRREAEQMASGAWLRPDRDEAAVKVPPEPCENCGEPYERTRGVKPKAHLCPACMRKGIRSHRCECGAFLKSWDMSSRNGWKCATCRGGVEWDEAKRERQRRYSAAHRAKRKSQATAGLAPAFEGA